MDMAVVIFLVDVDAAFTVVVVDIVVGIMQQRFCMFKFKNKNIKLKRKIITIKREKLKEIDLNLYSSLAFIWFTVSSQFFSLFFICFYSVFLSLYFARVFIFI